LLELDIIELNRLIGALDKEISQNKRDQAENEKAGHDAEANYWRSIRRPGEALLTKLAQHLKSETLALH